MATLLCMYKRHLTDSGMEKAVADMYKVQNLKRKLIQHCGEKIQFHQQYERNKSELVCSSSLNLAEIINLVAELTEAAKDSRNAPAVADTCAQVLYHAAIILRSEMKSVTGIETQPLNVSDISIPKATEVVPARLKQFLRWLLQSQRASFEGEGLSIDDPKDLNESVLKENETRNILAIGQDIISCKSGGRKKMPKNVGLGLAMKTMVRGKEIITMLNHHGHCVSYWECEQIDTKWSEMSLNQFEEEDGYYQAILPLNVASGTFVQSAADNADYLQDSVAGNESVHVMSMAFYQEGFALDPKKLVLPTQNISKVRRRALTSAETKLYELAFTSKTPLPTFAKQVEANFFQQCALEREKLQGLNQAWVFTRNTPTKLVTVEVGQTQAKQNVPGWTGFHAIVIVNNSRPTRISFPPMIPATVKEPNTVYTCLKSLDKTFRESLRQKNAVVTFDDGIYCEAKHIQWATSPELVQCNCSTGRVSAS